MALRAKYQQLIDAANQSGVTNLQVREQENVLYIDGNAPSEQVKKNLWDLYNKIDPDYRAGDLVLNVNVLGGEETKQAEEYEVVKGDNLTKIGKKYGMGWKEIYEANKDVIKDPDLIQPGWKLKIPSK
jgi:nucleoid-associated protein YgaU